MADPIELTLAVEDAQVSGFMIAPPASKALYVFAHSAGAGMRHADMTAIAEGLAARRIATLRYQFLYMERGSKRPDPPRLAHAAVRAAVEDAARRAPNTPLFAGGRSFGGRMTSQAQAAAALPGMRGLVFFGFPLHPAGKPATERAAHLAEVGLPMLFLQGARDDLADLTLLEPVIEGIGPRATLRVFDGADHSLHVLARSGQTNAGVRDAALDVMSAWIDGVLAQA